MEVQVANLVFHITHGIFEKKIAQTIIIFSLIALWSIYPNMLYGLNLTTMRSSGDAPAVFTTPGEAPRTLQKEWGDSLELELNGDMIRVI